MHKSRFRGRRNAFRMAVDQKGWTMVELAYRWGVTPEHLSRLASSPDRPIHWNDAVAGLPVLTRHELARLRKKRLAAQPASLAPARSSQPADKSPPRSGYSYSGALVPGAILIAVREIGGLAKKGDEVVVLGVEDTGAGELYRLAFPGGKDTFAEADVERYLVETGRMK